MAKGFNASRFKSQMRQAQHKAEQQIKQAQHKAEQQIKSELKKVTRKLENDMNRELRKYNSEVRHNQQIVNRELNKLRSHSTVQSTYTVSLGVMQQRYAIVGDIYANAFITPEQERILDLVEQEQANSLITANAVENEDFSEDSTADIEIGNKLKIVSEDLHNRWKGAVFALSPQNPDAARHFCTSVRELLTEFIEIKAPDSAVIAYDPNCERTPERETPTRRAKIKYMMRNMDLDDSVADFADADIQNIVELFKVLSGGTHGAAGKYQFDKLLLVKKRVEQGINFLCEISA